MSVYSEDEKAAMFSDNDPESEEEQEDGVLCDPGEAWDFNDLGQLVNLADGEIYGGESVIDNTDPDQVAPGEALQLPPAQRQALAELDRLRDERTGRFVAPEPPLEPLQAEMCGDCNTSTDLRKATILGAAMDGNKEMCLSWLCKCGRENLTRASVLPEVILQQGDEAHDINRLIWEHVPKGE